MRTASSHKPDLASCLRIVRFCCLRHNEPATSVESSEIDGVPKARFFGPVESRLQPQCQFLRHYLNPTKSASAVAQLPRNGSWTSRAALVANSLCLGQQKHAMHKREV
jgi:hypothetical protein